MLVWGIAQAFDLCQLPRDLWQVYIRRRHRHVLRESVGDLSLSTNGRFAVVAVYPNDDSLPFTLNLLDALAAAGLWILVVSTRELAPKVLSALRSRAHHVIERANVGQDFGSYQIGIEWLARHRQLWSAQLLILANDSLFYPKAFAAEVQAMVRRQSPWQALFENRQHRYHAQSFFLLFRAEVLGAEAFQKFWAAYRPYSARVHAIRRGEHGLTTTLMRAGFVCDPAYSSQRLAKALVEVPPTLSALAELLPSAGYWRASRSRLLQSISECEDKEHGCLQHWTRAAVHQFEQFNPTQAGGLLCNHLFLAPLKRDVCYRDVFDIDQILSSAMGFDDAELAAMKRDLRRRGLGSELPVLRRLLYLAGRL